MKEGQEDKRSEEHAFAMKKRSLWRSSGPCRSSGPLQKQKTAKNQSRLARSDFLLTFFFKKKKQKSMRAARAIVKTQIAGVTISMHHEDTENVIIYFPGLAN